MEPVHRNGIAQIYLKVQRVKNENVIMCDRKGVIYKGEIMLINLSLLMHQKLK